MWAVVPSIPSYVSLQYEDVLEKAGLVTVSALLDVSAARLKQARIPAQHVAAMLRAAGTMKEQGGAGHGEDFALLIPME